MDNSLDLKIRQADSRDRWALASKLELILLPMIAILATPYCFVLAYEAIRADNILAKILILGIIFALVPLPLWRVFSTLFRKKWSCFWLAECDDRIVAIAKISRYRQYIAFDKIKVKSKYRKQSIGSSVVEQILKKEGKPTYSCIPAKALKFFRNLGFEQIAKKQVPEIVNFEINKFNLGELVYVLHKNEIQQDPLADNKKTDALENVKKIYKARPANIKDVPQIRALVSLSIDLFLPLGCSSSAVRILLLKSYFILFAALLLASSINDSAKALLVQIFYFSVFFVLVLLPIILFTSAYFGPQNFSKFWLLESDGKVVGYARVNKHQTSKVSPGYSVVQHLYICELHRHPSVELMLVERIVKYVKGSFYMEASQDRSAWLTELGFKPIAPEQFPPQYQFGATIGAFIKHTPLALHKS